MRWNGITLKKNPKLTSKAVHTSFFMELITKYSNYWRSSKFRPIMGCARFFPHSIRPRCSEHLFICPLVTGAMSAWLGYMAISKSMKHAMVGGGIGGGNVCVWGHLGTNVLLSCWLILRKPMLAYISLNSSWKQAASQCLCVHNPCPQNLFIKQSFQTVKLWRLQSLREKRQLPGTDFPQ